MNILHVVHGYPPSIGGSQILLQQLSEHLVSDYGDRVTVFTTNACHMESFWTTGMPMMPTGTTTVNGVKIRRFPVFNRFNSLRRLLAAVAYRLRLPYNDWLRTFQTGPLIPDMTDAVARSTADIVLAATFPLMHMYYALRGARRAGIPIVFLGAIHTSDPWGYDRRMIYRAIRRADAYLALTTHERDYLVARGIGADTITIVGPGVDPDSFAAGDRAKVRQRHEWGDAPVVAMMAKQTARKGFDLLLGAMSQVWRDYPDTHLLLAGARTPYSEQITSIIRRLPQIQQEKVTVVDDFDEDEKADLLSACDVFVLPSGEESFGIAFIEAWACAKPVIGVHAGAVPSVIDAGQDGLLVKDGDTDGLAAAIIEMLDKPERRAEMGRAGQRKVLNRYTWKTMSRRVRVVYQEVLSQQSG